MKNPIIKKCQELYSEGLSVSSVRIAANGNRMVVTISVNSFVPLGEGGDLPHHKVSIDYKNCPIGVGISGFDRYPNEEFELRGNDEQAEALIRDVAQVGDAMDVVKIGNDWITKPNRWFFSVTGDGQKIDKNGNEL